MPKINVYISRVKPVQMPGCEYFLESLKVGEFCVVVYKKPYLRYIRTDIKIQ